MKRCLIIFAKEPRKGKVKTRFHKRLSRETCLNLYRAFLKDAVHLAKTADCETRIVAYAAKGKIPAYFKKIAPSFDFYKQRGRNFGRRIHDVFRFASKNKDAKIVIIGSDSPALPPRYIKQAFNKLTRSDLVLGPTHDGGYYLIGLKKPCSGLFRGVKWSTCKTMENTITNARRLNKKVSLLPESYDVDEPESFSYLERDLRKRSKKTALWTRRFLKI